VFNNLPRMNNRSLPHRITALLACFTLAFVVTAKGEEKAAEPRPPSKSALKKYDADHDGSLSDEEKARAKAEAKAKREAKKEEALKKYDANDNGKLDQPEKEKMKAETAAKRRPEGPRKKPARRGNRPAKPESNPRRVYRLTRPRRFCSGAFCCSTGLG
jgi:hypothetical protein